ncbi:MAG: extracellular solute-binding protein [Oscillospiraceae bacterium]|nr:extracellular solute-binding protein [Oscillospiraceae bacterium]
MTIFKKAASAFIAAALLFTFCGCGQKKPMSPTKIEIWHYYNGIQQQEFSELVTEFNNSVGREKGILVTDINKGSLSEIRDLVNQSAKKAVGSDPLPAIFSTYADTAFEFYQQDLLADISSYVSDKERELYISEYLEEGEFAGEGSLMLWPIAKSTEVFMLNETDWEPFAKKYNLTTDSLRTYEGITEVAKKYYEYTDSLTNNPNDGKAFFGRDSLANYMIIGSLQLGSEIFTAENGRAVINLDKQVMRRLWDNYYVPYVSGHFTASGRYRSDDAKTGDIIALIGSTSSAAYFPDHVTRGDGSSYRVSSLVLPAPHFENSGNFAVQQGAGMAIVKSDKETEQAAVEFLKWFTEPEQNLRFTAPTGYLPVRRDSNDLKTLQKLLDNETLSLPVTVSQTISAGMETINTNTMYTNGAFQNSYDLRNILERSMQAIADSDRDTVEAAIELGLDLDKTLEPMLSDEKFEQWYDGLTKELYAANK